MSNRRFWSSNSSFCFIFLIVSALLVSGCGGVRSSAALLPSPTPSPSPAPTPETFAPDHILVKGGLNGEIHREFAITGSGLQQIGGDITLPIQDRLGAPAMISARGYLFALDSVLTAVVDTFRFDPSAGTFSLVNQTGIQTGVGTFSVDPSGAFLYVNSAHDDPPGSYESNLSAQRIGSDGSFTQVAGSPFVFFGGATAGSGCCDVLTSSLAFTPDGTKAYATQEFECPCHSSPSAIWSIASFQRDPATGAISKNTVQQGAAPTSLDFMFSLAVVKNGKFLVFPTTDGLMVYSIDSSNGFLTKVPVVSPLPPTDIDHIYLDTSATRDGEFVYIDQPNSGVLYGFHVENDGSLTPVPGSPYNIAGAGAVTVSNTDNFVFVLSLPNLLAFRRDPKTGALTLSGSAALNIPVHAVVNLN